MPRDLHVYHVCECYRYHASEVVYVIALRKLYSSILAVTSLVVDKWSVLATRYNIVLLLVTFAVYAARDIWPFATVEGVPMDASYGKLLWIRIAILALTAIITPLFIPRRYIPIDPKAKIFCTYVSNCLPCL